MRLDGPVRLEGPMMVFEGYYISDDLYERVKPNDAMDWVTALWGEPTTKSALADGTEVWKWVYREQGFNSSIVQMTKSKDAPTLPQALTFLRVRDNVVIDKWRG